MNMIVDVLDAFRALTPQEWLLGTALVMAGQREARRQEMGLARIRTQGERHPNDRLSRRATLVWGHAMTFIGLGLVWSPLAYIGWVVGGIARLLVVPGPCETPIFNRYPYRLVRNGFLIALGSGCIAYGLSPLF